MRESRARIAIIPARGGSKRIPRKNIREMCGRPLIAYTIDAALESKLFDRVIVSTDCHEIAKVAREFGADVPFLRGEALADDLTPVSLVTVDALARVDPVGDKYDQVAQLMPNCPLRSAEDLENSLEQFERTGAEAQLSVTRYCWQNPWWAMERNESLELKPIFENRVTARSQDIPALFCPTGAIWWAQTDVLRNEKTFHVAGRTGWEIRWQRGIDIDTEDDWAIAETLIAGLSTTIEAYA